MKRIAILLAVVAMFVSTATIALADDDVDVDADDAVETSEPREFNEAEVQKLDALAGFLVDEPSAEGDSGVPARTQIEDLRYGDPATGWGAIFKLLQLAKASDTSLSELLEEIDGEGWGFGWRFKAIDVPVKADDDAPKNFGQLKKQNKAEKSNNGKKPSKP
jgi:hypothetical protein